MGCACNAKGIVKPRAQLPIPTRPRSIVHKANSPSKSARESNERTATSDKALRNWRSRLKHRSTKSLDLRISLDKCKDNANILDLINEEVISEKLMAGPAASFRWSAWKAALNVSTFIVPGKYEQLKEYKGTSKYLEIITQDVARTFPELLCSSEALENILAAYSIFNETVGYCQGMNYIAGLLLLVSELKEEEAFWTFVTLMEQCISFDYLPLCGLNKLFVTGFPLVKLFEDLFLRVINDNLRAHLNSLDLPIELWFHKWISSLFLYNFPISHCIRFWDAMMSKGISFFLPLSCAILNRLTPKLLETKTIEKYNGILKITQQIIDELLCDPESIIMEAKELKINWESLDDIVQKHTQCIVLRNLELLPQFHSMDSHDRELLMRQIDLMKENGNDEKKTGLIYKAGQVKMPAKRTSSNASTKLSTDCLVSNPTDRS